VGTPGRLMDHLDRGTLNLDEVRMVILDEADRMLDMGFRDDMETILSQVPSERQTLFFSATMNKEVERLIEHFGNEPEQIRIQRKTLTVASVEQCYFEVRNRSKIEVVSRLLDINPPKLAIVFCNTKRAVDECCDALVNRGYAVDRIHGDITQAGRERVLRAFRNGKVEILVATDVAARGLDIDEVEAVFNYDLPQDPEDYVHRIGRTGRAGRGGKAYSFVFGKDLYRLGAIERYIKQTIPRSRIPSQEEIEGRQTDIILELAKDRLDSGAYRSYGDWIENLLSQGYTATEIASALFSLLKEQTNRDGETIAEDTEVLKPERQRHPRKSRDSRNRKPTTPSGESGPKREKKKGGHSFGESRAGGKRRKKKDRHNPDKGKPAWSKGGKKRERKGNA
ncbi:MAG: DEAD/DEAH box helicase, partial [Verrucomicrobiae bacterium]|nr:DEAD/DEAH box helicase [Verrucomicrobiae bacterium]